LRLIIIFVCLLTACINISQEETVEPTPPASEWDVLADGLEQDLIREGAVFYQTVRINPEHYTFRAHYRPGEALTIEEWKTVLPDAEVIINANFFTEGNFIVGMLIKDGVAYGSSYTDRGGTFFVDDDAIGIRSNIAQPYQGEAFNQAIQAFPMLVMDGQPAYNRTSDTAISRRTLIAQDADGNILLMVTSGFGISLYDLSQYLGESDLNITTALNLDGGGSTMMYIAESDTTVVSFDPVPAVLAVYSR